MFWGMHSGSAAIFVWKKTGPLACLGQPVSGTSFAGDQDLGNKGGHKVHLSLSQDEGQEPTELCSYVMFYELRR